MSTSDRTKSKNYLILGAGISGLSIAVLLSKIPGNKVIVLEAESKVGGLASTIEFNGFHFDTGSHRIHASTDEKILSWLATLCHDDLLSIKRDGKIFVQERLLDYPLHIHSMLSGFGLRRFYPLALSFIIARFLSRINGSESLSYEEYVSKAVGRLLYDTFFRPYAEKLYGRSASEIACEPAIHRISKFHLRDVISLVRQRSANEWQKRFLYPRFGIGQVADSLSQEILKNGGEILLNTRVEEIHASPSGAIEGVIAENANGEAFRISAGQVISTLPLKNLIEALKPVNQELAIALKNLEWRSLRLLHVIVPGKLPDDIQTYYFPEPRFQIGRVSETAKYSSSLNRDEMHSALTIEVPCSVNDAIWQMSESEFADLCIKELRDVGILPNVGIEECRFLSRRLSEVYPVFKHRWKENLLQIFHWTDRLSGLYLLGRSALFLHCNIDHCIAMAMRLFELLSSDRTSTFDWNSLRSEFGDYSVRE